MRIFISYSRKDEAAAHLLGHILQSHGIQCEIDRKLPVGEPFDINLMKKIDNADAVLLILSKSSVDSTWVNQEIGYATACEKKIYPLAIESDVQPKGMIAAAQSYSLTDWSDTSHTIKRLLATLGQSKCDGGGHYQSIGLDQVIRGKLNRTQFLVERFQELRADKSARPLILHQAAFSIFAAGENTIDTQAPDHNQRYARKLLEEKRELEQLIDSGAGVKLVVWPVRVRRVKERFNNLIEWMERMLSVDRVSYACSEYPGPNQYIVPGCFCAEGFKLHDKSGYEMTVVKYQPDVVTEAERVFANTFEEAYASKEKTIQQVKLMYSNLHGHPLGPEVDDSNLKSVE